MTDYSAPAGGLPPQSTIMTQRAVFTDAYAVIPRSVQTDIVTSFLPHWRDTRLWVLARPLSGFATTFSQYLVEVQPRGGSEQPESDEDAQAVLFVVDGHLSLTIVNNDQELQQHVLSKGSYVYLPPGSRWTLVNDTNGVWSTSRFVEPDDLRHDMHVNIVTFKPGGVIPFPETHVMEHGLFILEGKAVYKLNQDWVEVEAGDFLWLRAFCPQACYAGGPGDFRYLLYKDVNRHMPLSY